MYHRIPLEAMFEAAQIKSLVQIHSACNPAQLGLVFVCNWDDLDWASNDQIDGSDCYQFVPKISRTCVLIIFGPKVSGWNCFIDLQNEFLIGISACSRGFRFYLHVKNASNQKFYSSDWIDFQTIF